MAQAWRASLENVKEGGTSRGKAAYAFFKRWGRWPEAGWELSPGVDGFALYREAAEIASRRGYKKGWAAVAYKQRVGVWPPRDWQGRWESEIAQP